MPLAPEIYMHMLTGRSEVRPDGKEVVHTEIRTFVKTDNVIDGHHLYVEKMP
jgi:hypothetical protein